MLSKLITLSLLSTSISGFYVPGVAPTDYQDQGNVEIKAVKMTSSKTQLPYLRGVLIGKHCVIPYVMHTIVSWEVNHNPLSP